jgi:hypothetical protein
MKHTLIYTALPIEGSSPTRVGVFVSPRLEPPSTSTLGAIPTMLEWPKTLVDTMSFEVQVEGIGAPVKTTLVSTPELALWKSLFKAATEVRKHEMTPLHTRAIRSFPVSSVLQHIHGLYRAVAEASPAGLPVYQAGKDNGAVDALVNFISEVGALAAREVGTSFTRPPKQEREGRGERFGRMIYGDRKVLDFNADYSGGGGNQRAVDFALAVSFHDRPGRQTSINDPKFERIKQKELEFHEIVASLANYPEIMRRLGLVFELELQLGGMSLANTGRIRIKPIYSPTPADLVSVEQPWTNYEVRNGRFIALARKGGDLDAGMLLLDGAGDGLGAELAKNTARRFSLMQVDADGAAMKAVDFAINLRGLTAQNMDFTNPDTAGLPALRTAGIALLRHNRGYNVYQNLQQIAARNTAIASTAPNLYLDDILRGYRVDIQDADGQWFTLMARDGFYNLTKPDGSYAGANPLQLSDEGFVTGSSATSDLAGSSDLYLHESMFRWEGWSLVAARPGKTIVRKDDAPAGQPTEVPEHRQNTAAGAHVHMEANFRATPKTLPRLRFGESYRMRARVVDLGGYSPRLEKAPTDAKYLSNAMRYSRFEPVAQPFVVLRDRVREGESAERMVIRSNYDKTTADYANHVKTTFNADFTPENERWLAPPKTSQLTAEQHAMFDPLLKAGQVAEAYKLATKEEGTFLDVEIVDHTSVDAPNHVVTGSKILNTPATPVYKAGEQEVRRKILRESDRTHADEAIWTRGEPLAPGQYVIHTEVPLLLPYLPDPIARGCAIEGLRDVKGNGTIPGGAQKAQLAPFGPFDRTYNVVKIPFDGNWPDRAPFRIVVRERPGTINGEDCVQTFTDAELPPVWDAANRLLIVYLGKGETMRLRYSSYLDKNDLYLMGIWKWLDGSPRRNDFEPYGTSGIAWMVTPYRDLTIVHAVQQPICAPKIVKYAAHKQLGKTFATFSGMYQLNVPSTGRIDVKGKWTEWVDPLNEAGPKQIDGAGQAFTFDVPETAPNNLPAPPSVGKPLDEFRHEFNDTRYRKIDYYLVGTTRFREYFPRSIWSDPANITREGKPFTGVKVLNSARPLMPTILYVVPTFGWQRPEGGGGGEVVSRRCGGGLRVYIDRPWYSSGDEELLGIILPKGGKITEESPLKPYVTQWGLDPAWSGYPTYSLVQTGHFKSFEKDGYDLTLDELPNQMVNVVGYTPGYDEDRRLWYCDIEVDTGPAYYPFIRLALARFQPNSVPNAHLSRVVMADFVQLASDRSASVVFDNENMISVFVSGNFGMNEATVTTSDLLANMRFSRRVTIELEEQEGAPQDDDNWRPVGSSPVELTPVYEKEFKLKLLWQGRLQLPGGRTRRSAGGTANFRVVIKEWEFFDADPNRDGSAKMENGRWMGRRLVYADAIEI